MKVNELIEKLKLLEQDLNVKYDYMGIHSHVTHVILITHNGDPYILLE